jgi:ElaB/YqjD/DUF883 family membrane-anchored ribosome-binding protein
MSDSNNTRSGAALASSARDLRDKASDAFSKLSDVTQDAMGEAKKSAGSLAAEATQRAKGALQERVATGADLIGHVAASAHAAADNLDPNAPQLAGLLRDAGQRMDDFSRDLRDKSIDELIETSVDFARRQPAVLFGVAAATGFLLFRVFKAAASASGGPGGGVRQPASYPQSDSPPITGGQFHGT